MDPNAPARPTTVVGGSPRGWHFTEGEKPRTELHAKFRRERVESELAESGFAVSRWWTAAAERCALVLAHAAGED
ncbi:L-histidine N(alpha)-methyltransferase [Parasphingorhabdus pacifica]